MQFGAVVCPTNASVKSGPDTWILKPCDFCIFECFFWKHLLFCFWEVPTAWTIFPVLHWMHHPTGSELLPQFAVSFYHFTYWLVLHWLTINHAALNFKHNHKILIAIVGSIQETACLVCVHQFLCLVHFGEPSLLLTAWCRWAFLLWLVFSLTVVTSCIISAINLVCGPFLLAFHAPFYCFIRFWEVFAEVFSS